jgi:hypothetical protein
MDAGLPVTDVAAVRGVGQQGVDDRDEARLGLEDPHVHGPRCMVDMPVADDPAQQRRLLLGDLAARATIRDRGGHTQPVRLGDRVGANELLHPVVGLGATADSVHLRQMRLYCAGRGEPTPLSPRRATLRAGLHRRDGHWGPALSPPAVAQRNPCSPIPDLDADDRPRVLDGRGEDRRPLQPHRRRVVPERHFPNADFIQSFPAVPGQDVGIERNAVRRRACPIGCPGDHVYRRSWRRAASSASSRSMSPASSGSAWPR